MLMYKVMEVLEENGVIFIVDIWRREVESKGIIVGIFGTIAMRGIHLCGFYDLHISDGINLAKPFELWWASVELEKDRLY